VGAEKPAGDTMGHISSNPSNPPAPPCSFRGTLLIHATARRGTGSPVWEVELPGPDCERRRTSNHTRSELEQLDQDLDRAPSEIETEIGPLEAVHMEEWIVLFVRALDLNFIGADDF
jgi:hypothetical protein